MIPCYACGGSAHYLGELADLVWFRCRYCGSDTALAREPGEDPTPCSCGDCAACNPYGIQGGGA